MGDVGQRKECDPGKEVEREALMVHVHGVASPPPPRAPEPTVVTQAGKPWVFIQKLFFLAFSGVLSVLTDFQSVSR